MNYVRELVRSSEYRQIPDLNPVRHVLYKGAWLRVDGWRAPRSEMAWDRLIIIAVCAGIALGCAWALVADLL